MMRSLALLLPEVAARDTMVLYGTPGSGLLTGQYGFCEFYCADPVCDCRLVQFLVHRNDSHLDWAAINYGWESAFFYARWARCSVAEARKMCQPALDTVSTQSPYATILLRHLTEHLRDRRHGRRLARHYRLFKQAVQDRTRNGSLPQEW